MDNERDIVTIAFGGDKFLSSSFELANTIVYGHFPDGNSSLETNSVSMYCGDLRSVRTEQTEKSMKTNCARSFSSNHKQSRVSVSARFDEIVFNQLCSLDCCFTYDCYFFSETIIVCRSDTFVIHDKPFVLPDKSSTVTTTDRNQLTTSSINQN